MANTNSMIQRMRGFDVVAVAIQCQLEDEESEDLVHMVRYVHEIGTAAEAMQLQLKHKESQHLVQRARCTKS